MWYGLPDELVARIVAIADVHALPVVARLDVRSRRVLGEPPNRLMKIAALARPPFLTESSPDYWRLDIKG